MEYFNVYKSLITRTKALLSIEWLNEKWLRYRQFRVSVVVGGGGVVGSDALLSTSPSLIWLQLRFGLAGAVTIIG